MRKIFTEIWKTTNKDEEGRKVMGGGGRRMVEGKDENVYGWRVLEGKWIQERDEGNAGKREQGGEVKGKVMWI